MDSVTVSKLKLLDRLIAQGRAIPASEPGPIPPTPPRDDREEGLSLSAALDQMRDDERLRDSVHAMDLSAETPA